LTYTNKDLGFSLELPASWENKYSIDELDNSVAFLHTESKLKTRAQGELFAIIRYPGKMTNEQAQNGAGMRSLVFTTDKYSYVLATPSGVEYSDETEDDYLKMSADIASILKTVKKY
jgi:ribulose-5-phosphate 4-epimerase/fuculose-1-phosphate aldolase